MNNQPAMTKTAVLVIGSLYDVEGHPGPHSDAVVHVFNGPDLLSTFKIPQLDMLSEGDLERFLGQYTQGKFSVIR
jgi:hypothetical protein